MSERPLTDSELELAALYALAALSGPEMEALEREQREHAAFWREVRSLRDAAAGLAESGPRARPRRDLWPAIRARLGTRGGAPHDAATLRTQVWKAWRAQRPSDDWTLAARDGDFEPTDLAGIRVRRLFVDEEADRITMLVRMDAGAAYPAHRHGGAEECYVLEGDLEIVGKQELRAGDYQRMETGSLHPVQRTRGGCLLLITSSRHDELVA